MPRSPRSHVIRPRLLAALIGLTLGVVACASDQPADHDPSPTATAGSDDGQEAQSTATPQAMVNPRYAAVPAREREAVAGPLQPDPFEDAATLLEQLRAAELAIRSDATSEQDLIAWSWTQQQAYRDLVDHPQWRDEVRAGLPEQLRSAFDRNVDANVELRELTRQRDSLPEWRIVSPPSSDELLGHYRSAAEEFGIGWEYLAAIHLSESRMGRIRGASVAGARGPMQFMPATWEAYGEGDVDDPHDAIRAAARYLVDHGAPADMQSALFAYNRSQHYVNAIAAHAAVMREDPASYRAYYHWRVYYRMVDGEVILPEGWESD